MLAELQERPTSYLLTEAIELLSEPGATAQDKDVVRAAQARAQELQRSRARDLEARREAARRARGRALSDGQEQREADAARREADRARREEEQQRRRDEADQAAVFEARSAKATRLTPTVRGALKKAARERRTTTWTQIGEKTGERQLARLDHQDKVELLVLVDKGADPGTPLLSTLLAADGDNSAVRLYRAVGQRLGRPLPDDDIELMALLVGEREQLHRWPPS
ncbi:hypothetical protein [Streptomyces sp. NPDC047525]|uniref:hypothetical protein n=1 Tax=Streptomyces sp. NPDC047525 TaxID=3155264 RepID=UPI00340576C3